MKHLSFSSSRFGPHKHNTIKMEQRKEEPVGMSSRDSSFSRIPSLHVINKGSFWVQRGQNVSHKDEVKLHIEKDSLRLYASNHYLFVYRSKGYTVSNSLFQLSLGQLFSPGM